MQWYYANEGQRQGPVSAEEFARLAEAGVIRPETLVWRAGMAAWKPYAEIAPPPLAAAAPAPALAEPGLRADSAAGGSFQAPAAGEQHVFIRGYGGFWRRFLAKIIDGFILNVITWIVLIPIMLPMFGGMGAFAPGAEPTPEQLGVIFGFQLIGFGVHTVLGLGYSIFFLRKYAATPGKMALGLKVYRSDSRPLSTGRIVGRYFAEWVSHLTLGIGYLIAAFDAEKRALHDHIADTRVVLVQP